MAAVAAATSASARSAIMTNYVIGFSGLAICFAIALWLSIAKISRPLGRLNDRMNSLAQGNFDVEIEGRERGDEIGAMAKSVEVFKQAGIEKIRLESQSEEQRKTTDEERRRNEAARAAAAKEVQHVVDALGVGLEHLAQGDLCYRIDVEVAAEYKKVRDDFNAAINQLQETI